MERKLTQYESDLFENIVTMKDKVGYVLKKYPETRNSDQELVERVSKLFELDPLKIYETVRRSRQQFNEKGEFLPTDWNVARQRKINQEVWQRALGYPTTLF